MTSKGYHKLSVKEKEQKEDENNGSSSGNQPKKFSRRYKILFGLFTVLMFGVGVTVGIVLRQKTGKINRHYDIQLQAQVQYLLVLSSTVNLLMCST